MHIRGSNLILVADLRTTQQSFRTYFQQLFQLFSQSRNKSFATNCHYQTTTSNLNAREHQHYQNFKHQKSLFDGSLPNKNVLIQALRKRSEIDGENGSDIRKETPEKRKGKKSTDASKAFIEVNEALSSPYSSKLTSFQALSLYKNLYTHYRLKPFYLDLISYLLRQFANIDRLDLMEVVFAQFVRDVNASERKYLIGGYVTKVWNMISCIYAEKGRFEEVRILFENMPRYMIIPNDKTYKTLIKSASKGKNIYLCFSYLQKLIVRGHKLDCDTLNTLLHTCLIANSDSYKQESIDIIINLMSLWRIGPNGETLRILLQYCKNFDSLEGLWAKIINLRFHDNPTLQVEIIKMCSRLAFGDHENKDIRIAENDKLSLVKELAEKREAGMPKCLDYLLRILRKSQGEIEVGAYNNLLSTCVRRGDITRGMKILEMMWSKNLEPSIRGYQQMLDTIGRPITFSPTITIETNIRNDHCHLSTLKNTPTRDFSIWNLSKQSAFIKTQREHLWKLLEGMFTRPKTSIMPKRLISAILFAFGRLGDSRGLLEFYEARIKLEQLRLNDNDINSNNTDGSDLSGIKNNKGNNIYHSRQLNLIENSTVDLSSIENRFAIRSSHINMDISLFNLFMRAISLPSSPLLPLLRSSPKKTPFSDLSPLELFNKLPIHIEPNQETIEHLFSNVRTLESFKTFGLQFLSAILTRSTKGAVNFTREGLEKVIMRATGRTYDEDGNNGSNNYEPIDNDENFRNAVVRCIVHEIANVCEGKDVTECLKVLEQWEKKEGR
ncbi:10680_t:CDS:2 [Acaulospora morrowiae]|uniref:10680_t:CDS:1 n=1 Tax=Acaulospora morrowiae TaxID=94023 RepID=A0A9N9AKR3_9GLOM|nr:10680_t:CDS:2 [Acaulospora morrowiae]